MGILFIVFIIIALITFFISKLKLPKRQKVLWSAATIIIAFILIAYLFIEGFERGRDPQSATEKLQSAIQ